MALANGERELEYNVFVKHKQKLCERLAGVLPMLLSAKHIVQGLPGFAVPPLKLPPSQRRVTPRFSNTVNSFAFRLRC